MGHTRKNGSNLKKWVKVIKFKMGSQLEKWDALHQMGRTGNKKLTLVK